MRALFIRLWERSEDGTKKRMIYKSTVMDYDNMINNKVIKLNKSA